MSTDDRGTAPGHELRAFRRLAGLIWYGLTTFVVLAYLKAIVVPALAAARQSDWAGAGELLSALQALVGLVLLVAAFLLVGVAVRVLKREALGVGPRPAPPGPTAFPAPVTLSVGAWVLLLTFLSLFGLVLMLRAPSTGTLRGALLTMFAAGVGSSITTILGYLKHASEQKDFDPAYTAWYIGRPVIGLLLGLLFYFVLKGGLMATVATARDINDFGLVAAGGLVGLFSKNAVEKLHELFNVLFQTREQAAQAFLERLPEPLKQQVRPYLASSRAAQSDPAPVATEDAVPPPATVPTPEERR
ncbi:MAG: hypothetical protein ACHQQS_06380 [Thermoanaerobaculales bacterium]